VGVDAHMQALRAAVYAADEGSMSVIWAVGFDLCLQWSGEAARVAVRARRDGADALATACVAALWERGWPGDTELADAIQDDQHGSASTPLRELPVDLENLASLIDAGGPEAAGGAISLESGIVWPQFLIDDGDWPDGEPDFDDDNRWLWVEPSGSREAYEDMAEFAATRREPLASRLAEALRGRSVFRRFKDELLRRDEDRAEWFAFSEDRSRGRARAWLAGAGYRAAVPGTGQSSGG
jgi:hypothetical protein